MRAPPPDAIRRDGSPVYAAACSPATWDALKAESVADPGAFRMGCCGARAVLKTSLYGTQFAAHYSDECDTAPETIWHVAAKDAVLGALVALGVPARQEVPGGTGRNRWKADVLAEVGSRRIAFELQRSYQHFRDFERRQERYRLDGVECFWLLRDEVSRPLTLTIGRKRIKEEFGGKMPPEGYVSPNWPSLPWAILRPDQTPPILMPRLRLTVSEWVSAVVRNAIVYDNGYWRIAE